MTPPPLDGRYEFLDHTADLRLRWLDALVRSVELGRSGFGLIVSRERRIIAASHRGGERGEAIRTLQEIRAAGWARLTLVDEEDFASLRTDPEFAAVVAGVQQEFDTGEARLARLLP